MTVDEAELAYYRAVEDLFAGLRGVPHLLSPADFQLLRGWWRDRVPLAAIRAGLAEVIARRRDRGEADPVVSLRYCRHAVTRHAKRIAAMHVGATVDSAPDDLAARLSNLAGRLERAARKLDPPLDRVVIATSEAVRAAVELSPEQIEPHLYDLEAAMLDACAALLPDALHGELEAAARTSAAASGARDKALERTLRAHLDRLVRDRLALPRLELPGWS